MKYLFTMYSMPYHDILCVSDADGGMTMCFKICLVGCGGISETGHGPMLAKYAATHGGVALEACCDIDPLRARAFASRFGFAGAYAALDEMLGAVRPDAVLLAVPVPLTAGLAVSILRRGIPVLLEKPPGATMEEGRAIAAAAKDAGVPASVAFNRRTMPLVSALMAELAQCGDAILSAHVEMCRTGRADADFTTTAIHDIDLARFICGSDYESASFAYSTHEGHGADDLFMLARMVSGAVVSLEAAPMCGRVTERLTVKTHERLFHAELPVFGSPDTPGRIVQYRHNEAVAVIEGDGGISPAEANGFLGEHVSFFEAVRAGKTPAHSVEGSLQSLDVANRIRDRAADYRRNL